MRLAPLTLIYGPNSGGKSSLVEAIQIFCSKLEEKDLVPGIGAIGDAKSIFHVDLESHEKIEIIGALDRGQKGIENCHREINLNDALDGVEVDKFSYSKKSTSKKSGSSHDVILMSQLSEDYEEEEEQDLADIRSKSRISLKSDIQTNSCWIPDENGDKDNFKFSPEIFRLSHYYKSTLSIPGPSNETQIGQQIIEDLITDLKNLKWNNKNKANSGVNFDDLSRESRMIIGLAQWLKELSENYAVLIWLFCFPATSGFHRSPFARMFESILRRLNKDFEEYRKSQKNGEMDFDIFWRIAKSSKDFNSIIPDLKKPKAAKIFRFCTAAGYERMIQFLNRNVRSPNQRERYPAGPWILNSTVPLMDVPNSSVITKIIQGDVQGKRILKAASWILRAPVLPNVINRKVSPTEPMPRGLRMEQPWQSRVFDEDLVNVGEALRPEAKLWWEKKEFFDTYQRSKGWVGRKEIIERYNEVISEWLSKLTDKNVKQFRIRPANQKDLGSGYVMELKPRAINKWINFRHVGTGISQIVPIFMDLARSQHESHFVWRGRPSRWRNESHVEIQKQPELHLHPRQQANLADIFLEFSQTNQLICETHSELLVTRVKRRIREGKYDPKDVCILYVDPIKGESVVKELRLDSQGEFLDEWPGGFFEESFNDYLESGSDSESGGE